MRLAVLVCIALAGTPERAAAVESCELNGQHVNPSNGNTTTGKTGLMRCRGGEGGPVVREQELQRGVFMGVVRYFRDGQLEKAYRVNERGNRDGVAREYARGNAGAKPALVREETYRKAFEGAWRLAANGTRAGATATGVHRSFDSDGRLRGERFHDERGRVTRERELDAGGAVVRDDEVFEDGSRKAFAR